MPAKYDLDFSWQRRYTRQMKRICGEYLTTEASFDEDARHNTDLIVLGMEPNRVACRVRRYKYRAKYGDQFTIRASRTSGASTELAKILAGWGDYLLYGFGKDENLVFAPWTLADLDVFRRCWRQGLGQRQSNGDGSSDFLTFQWDQFPADFIRARSWRQSTLLLPNGEM